MAENSIKKRSREKFILERSSAWAQVSIIFMLLSAIFRLLGVWNCWDDVFFRNTQILLPLFCNLLFALCVFLFGKRGFFLSIIPVLMGVAFFIIKALGFASWIHTLLCILLYLAVAVLYSGTVLGLIHTKWLLPPLFGLPFLYHIFVEDMAKLSDTVNPMGFAEGMQELSVLCVMVSLFCVGMGLKKKKPVEEAVLPKIKDPVVRAPESESPATETETDTAGESL